MFKECVNFVDVFWQSLCSKLTTCQFCFLVSLLLLFWLLATLPVFHNIHPKCMDNMNRLHSNRLAMVSLALEGVPGLLGLWY